MGNLEDTFKGIVSIVVGIIMLSALAPILGSSNVFGLSSILIGLAFLAIILAFLAKILDLFGGNYGL